MSELKVHKIGDLCFDFKMGKDVGIDFYLKSEVDKLIAELEYKNEELRYSIAVLSKEKSHHKYKRCLAMKEYSASELEIAFRNTCISESVRGCVFFRRWLNKWIELADKFKDSK